MAQITELKVYGTMGGLYDRDFSGKEEYVEPGTLTDIDPDSDPLNAVVH